MKKSVLLLGIIAWVAVLAAAVIIAGFVWRGDINMYNGAASLKEEDILLFGIENIRIETDSLDIELQATGEPRMKVLQYGDTNTAAEELFVVTQYEGGLKISAKRLFKFFSISFTINERLVIQIPETWLGDISVSASSGNIRVHDV
ncbi:MAG: DUF4097 domain-containing protein, partial [Clostridiales bacterium]|nr:DUF4097 domain-containing protein [Clostridiales bacterium]